VVVVAVVVLKVLQAHKVFKVLLESGLVVADLVPLVSKDKQAHKGLQEFLVSMVPLESKASRESKESLELQEAQGFKLLLEFIDTQLLTEFQLGVLDFSLRFPVWQLVLRVIV
jgi:hypothetical protein